MLPETREDWPENSTFTFLRRNHGLPFISLHFCGLMVNREGVDKGCDLNDMLQDHTHKATSFRIQLEYNGPPHVARGRRVAVRTAPRDREA